MIPSDAASPAERWKEVLRRARAATLRISPWMLVLVLIPLLFEGTWRLKTIAGLTLLALGMLPLIFLAVVAVQLFPRSWYR